MSRRKCTGGGGLSSEPFLGPTGHSSRVMLGRSRSPLAWIRICGLYARKSRERITRQTVYS
ncbi:hypothetical protein PUNSTDRAFT_119019 [Punctularia strigosozonata HHB-11173 SS5]|uniref:uncharacterized protein n=1 Tax=Punctularia strigosozonata (strain HHB-11173) TaxID=741275 RepID=UPI0004417CC6|nr:uncharacterized protein PUNSTDRAFT_119019 [Punctularia strigosozonata HHB-11173 SS5]EIN11761.1 hypothetical protein PUNSTDRAFT_119019 [Punctularia strigosozonata HHB-11173 SS5]